MANEKVLRLLKDKSFREELSKTRSTDDAQKLFASKGADITTEDILTFRTEIKQKMGGELSEKEPALTEGAVPQPHVHGGQTTSGSMFAGHIALLKTLCLLAVIFGHAVIPFTEPVPGGFWKFYAGRQSAAAEFFCFWVVLVAVPSFMLASGYLAALSAERRRRSAPAYIAGRVKRLLVPWLLLTVFWMVPLYTLFDIPAFNRPETYTLAQTYRAGLEGLFADHLWFLLVLFWVDVFFAALRPLARRFGALLVPALALVAALLMNEYGRTLTWYDVWQTSGPLVWFGLGTILCRYRDGIGKALARHPVPLFGLNAVLFVVA
ncbi:MAG: acyltransferase, partial [Spirochaetaceae bacterium]|nr:acyltransferase [Spirochaetaceae bacterium]